MSSRRGFLGTLAALTVAPIVVGAMPDDAPPQASQVVVQPLPMDHAEYWIARLKAIYPDHVIDELYRTHLFSNARR